MKKLMTVLLATFALVSQGITLEDWQATVGKRFRVKVVERPAQQPKKLMSVAAASDDRLAAAEKLLKEIAGESLDRVSLSLVREFIDKADLDLLPWDIGISESIPAPFEKVLVGFIDDAPRANWSHPCRYVIFNADLTQYVVIHHHLPLLRIARAGSEQENLQLFPFWNPPRAQSLEEAVSNVRTSANLMRAQRPLVSANGVAATAPIGDPKHSYFLIIAGGAFPLENGIRFWSDAAMYYSTLTLKYGVPKENIVALVSGGGTAKNDAFVYVLISQYYYKQYVTTPNDLDGDGDSDISGPANVAAVKNALADLKSKLTSDDQLTVFITSHGSQIADDGKRAITAKPDNYKCAAFLFNMNPNPEELLHDYLLADWTKDIGCPVGFIIETCYSGGFIDDLVKTPDRVIATASRHDQMSWGTEVEFTEAEYAAFDGETTSFNDWVMPFTCALRGPGADPAFHPGKYPWDDRERFSGLCQMSADANGDGRISFGEAFLFSVEHDAYAADPTKSDYEEPQLAESTPWLGEQFFTLKQSGDVPSVSPGSPAGPYDTPEEAASAAKSAVFSASADVTAAITTATSRAIYAEHFRQTVSGPTCGKYYVRAEIYESGTNTLKKSATDMTANLDVSSIAALPAEGSTDISLSGGVPGFYYTLKGSAALTSEGKSYVSAPCPTDGTVSFKSVEKPSAASGFFSISAGAN